MTTIVYFSPTGNVRYLAGVLARKLGNGNTVVHALEFTDATTLKASEDLVLLYSIHAFNAPRTVRRFVKSLPASLFDRINLVGVGCNETWMNRATNVWIRKVLEQKGYEILIDDVLAMPLTLVTAFPKLHARRVIRGAEEKVGYLAQRLQEGAPSNVTVPLKAKVLQKIGRLEDLAARQFGLELHATKECKSCGVCVENCPEKNIRFKKGLKPTFGFNCMMCLRCIYECPEGAITPYISKCIPIKGGYSLQELLPKKRGASD